MRRVGLGRFQRAASAAWRGAGTRLRGADWAAIAFELALIVTGILIAFQLDRLAEDWRRGRDRALYLERLAEESADNLQRLGFSLDLLHEDTDELRAILLALSDPAARARLRPGTGCGLLRLPAVPMQTAALAESADPGALELVPDRELRQLINSAVAWDSFATSQLSYFRDGFQRNAERIQPFLIQRYDPGTAGVTCQMDVERLDRDAESASLIAGVYTDRVNFTSFRERQLNAHRRLHARLCHLITNCPRPEPAGTTS